MKITDLAVLIKGTVEGDDNVDVASLSGIGMARMGDLTFALDEKEAQFGRKKPEFLYLDDVGDEGIK